MAVDRSVLASGVTTTTEEVISTDEGTRFFQSTKGVYLDDAGQPAGIFGISRDITEQRRADDEHRRFEEALELTVEGVAHLDLEGRFIWVNDAFARLCGYPPLEMIGLPWSALAHPDDLDHMSAAHAGVAKGKRIEREVRTVRRDGSWFYAQLVVVMAKDGDGAHSGFYSTLRDVSDRKVAEEVARRASIELARRNAELEGFAAMVAHDLRQPLQVVGGFAQLLAERNGGFPHDERADRYLAAIERGVGKMTAMVESMLEYARAGAAEAPANLITDSHRIVVDVIDGLEGSMNGGQAIVSGRLPVLPADPDELSRLFENLIGNALKFRAEHPACRADRGRTRRQRLALHRGGQRHGRQPRIRRPVVRDVRPRAPLRLPGDGHGPRHLPQDRAAPRRPHLVRGRPGRRIDLLLHTSGRALRRLTAQCGGVRRGLLDAVAAPVLGPVQRLVRFLEHVFGRVVAGGIQNRHARAHGEDTRGVTGMR